METLAGAILGCAPEADPDSGSSAASITNAYWNRDKEQIVDHVPRDVADKVGVGSGFLATTAHSTEEMLDSSSYIGFDFAGVWDVIPGENDGFPVLRVFYALPDDPTPIDEGAGNVNDDDVVDMLDVLLLYRHFRGIDMLPTEQEGAADVNGDNRIDLQDVLLVYQYFRGKVTSFGG